MNSEQFYKQLEAALPLPVIERRNQFARLHTALLADYLVTLRATTAEQAARLVGVGEDRRSVAQVYGHIMEWDRWMILAAGDILVGLESPRFTSGLNGYIDEDGSTPTFSSIDEFNAAQASKHASWPWEKMQKMADSTACTLHTLLTYPQLCSVERLEATKVRRWRMANGTKIPELKMGWCLWIVAMEHMGAEHNVELGLP